MRSNRRKNETVGRGRKVDEPVIFVDGTGRQRRFGSLAAAGKYLIEAGTIDLRTI